MLLNLAELTANIDQLMFQNQIQLARYDIVSLTAFSIIENPSHNILKICLDHFFSSESCNYLRLLHLAIKIILFMNINPLLKLSLIIVSLVHSPARCQFSPLWQSTPYIEAKNTIIVSNAQKTYGSYSVTVTFSQIFSSAALALAIPQIRIISSSRHTFKIYHSSLGSNGFTLNLEINDPSTTVWYLSCRYIVFNTAILTKQFQTYFQEDIAGVNILSNPNGAYRSDSYPVSLSPTVTTANNPVCLPFLTGAEGTSTDAHYQLNLTCSITSSTSATITATVYPSTKISELTFYLVVWDPVLLAVQSYIFVDYAVTSTYYNVQKTFLSLPYGYYDSNYFGGFASFSTTINQIMNISLNSLEVATTSDSLYISVPQMQIRVRNCNSNNYPWYNKADGLCYAFCPSYTTQVTSSFLCAPCPTNCIACFNSSICTACSISQMTVINGLCACAGPNYLFNGACYGCHYSCLTCSTGQYYSCLACDSTAFRTIANISVSSSKCQCITGYRDNSAKVCLQICGDGVARTDACDDGNYYSGDGCSSVCTIEQNFTCFKNSSNFSSCYYIGNVTISQVKTIKANFQNKIKIYLKVSPWIDTMSQLANSISLTSNLSSSFTYGYSSERNLLVYEVTYNQDIQGIGAMIFLNPTLSGIFSILPPTNVTITMDTDNGYLLKYYTDNQYKAAESIQYITQILGYLMLVSAFLFIFGRLKWFGNLLFFSLQFMYLSMLYIPEFTPLLAGMVQIKTVMGFNDLYGQQQFDLPKYQAFNVLDYSKQYSYNVNIMVFLQLLAIIMYIIYFVTYRNNQKLCKKYGGDPQKTYKALKYGKFLIFFDWEFFMFWTFFNTTQQLTAMTLFFQLPDPVYLPLIFFNLACIFLALYPLFFRRKQVKSYTQLLYRQDRGHEQSIVSLIFFTLMYSLLAISITLEPNFYFIIFLVPILMMIYVLCRKPFQSKWMQAAYFVNCFCIITMLVYNELIINFEDDVFYLPFGSIITVMLDWIFNLIVWGRQAYVICKYGGQRDLNELLQSNTRTSSNNNIDQGNFRERQMPQRGNQSFLSSIMKNQSRRALKRNKKIDENMPEGMKEEHQRRVDEQEQEERQDIRKKRENYLKQIKEMKQIRQYRERSRLQADQLNKNSTKRMIRSTAQKGMDQSKINEINNNRK